MSTVNSSCYSKFTILTSQYGRRYNSEFTSFTNSRALPRSACEMVSSHPFCADGLVATFFCPAAADKNQQGKWQWSSAQCGPEQRGSDWERLLQCPVGFQLCCMLYIQLSATRTFLIAKALGRNPTPMSPGAISAQGNNCLCSIPSLLMPLCNLVEICPALLPLLPVLHLPSPWNPLHYRLSCAYCPVALFYTALQSLCP